MADDDWLLEPCCCHRSPRPRHSFRHRAAPPSKVEDHISTQLTQTIDSSSEVKSMVQTMEALAAVEEELTDAKKRGAGPFGETLYSTDTSDDVLLSLLLGWKQPADFAGLSAKALGYLNGVLDLISRPAAALFAAMKLHLAPCGTYDGLMKSRAAKSEACWLRVKTWLVLHAFRTDARIDRESLPGLADMTRTRTRAEWARAFGVALPLPTDWPLEAVLDRAALRRRVSAAKGRLDGLSVVEHLRLLRPRMVNAWHTPFAFFVQSTTHHAECLTTEGVFALAQYLSRRQRELWQQELARGGAAASGSDEMPPIVEVGSGDGRLAYLLNNSGVLGGDLRVEATDVRPLVGSGFPVSRLDANRAIDRHRPLIVLCAWMTCGEDWSPEWRQDMDAIEEYVLIGCRMDAACDGRDDVYALERAHGSYERHVLAEVSANLLGVADVLRDEDEAESPFRTGGSVCAIAYRRPPDRDPSRPCGLRDN
jgi:hypothetical protein